MQRSESDADIQRNYQEYARTVYKYLLSLTRDEQTAEELTQETFCQAIKSCEKYDGSCSMPTWLCAIAKNVLRTYRRKHPPHDDIDDILRKKECGYSAGCTNCPNPTAKSSICGYSEGYPSARSERYTIKRKTGRG